MKIAFLVSTFPKISETFILNQVVGLLESGHEVTIFSHRKPDFEEQHGVVTTYNLVDRTIYTDAPTSYKEALSTAMRTVFRHPTESNEVFQSIQRGKAGGERLANLQTLLDYSDFNEFDVIHAHFGTTAKAFDFLVENNRFVVGSEVPFVVSFYGYDVSQVITQNRQAYTDLFPICDAVTALSDDMVSKLVDLGVPRSKIIKQQLAINTNEYQFHERNLANDEQIEILTVARLTEKKGVENAIDAVARVSEEYDINYRIAGDGPQRASVERQIKKHGIENKTELLGWVNQQTVREALDDAHVFLLPSRTASNGDQEGTPTVLLEAQATGLPVVSTFHAGIPEIVRDGESGILVPENDTDGLVDALVDLFENSHRWPEMGICGRELVESTHSIPAMLERLERLYRTNM